MSQKHLSNPVLPSEVLQWHTQKSQQSCAASGMEMILKSHGLIPLDDFSIQLKYVNQNIGFGKEDDLRSRGIAPSNKTKPIIEALSDIESEILEDRFPLISLPVHREENRIWFHIFVAEPNSGLMRFLDPATAQLVEGKKEDLAKVVAYMKFSLGDPNPTELNYLTYRIEKTE
jgi:hypothetical protein